MRKNHSLTFWMDCGTVFLGSFLLFLVQPLLGRTLLPIFGGSAAVWGVCLAIYQLLLLGGYLYADALAKRNLRTQRVVHLAGLALAVLWLFAFLSFRKWAGSWAVSSLGIPWLKAAGCVMACIGIPYLLLSAGSSLLQSWVARVHTDVYRLYAWSNAGSFLGLLCFPFLLEPFLSIRTQWELLTAGVVLYGIAVAFVSQRAVRAEDASPPPLSRLVEDSVKGQADARHKCRAWVWYVIPGMTTFLLNAVVAHLFMDVTPLPLVWVLMLSAFLLSYTLGFSKIGFSHPRILGILSVLSLAGAAAANGMWGTGSFYPNAGAGIALLLFVGTFLHGWLYTERPSSARLTKYYLGIAVGGAVGGILSAFAAPLLFDRVAEYPLAICGCAFLIAWHLPKPAGFLVSAKRQSLWCSIVAFSCSVLLFSFARRTGSRVLYRARNFYGTISVTRVVERIENTLAPVSYLWYGQTTHGLQVDHDSLRRHPLSYYTPGGGGAGVISHPKYKDWNKPMNVGVVGLGVGALSAYGRPKDLYRFYEINPQVIDVARDGGLFTYLRQSLARIDLILGDARNMLAIEDYCQNPLYDVLYIDAYSGDSVPYHLITREAFELYLRRLKPDGILAVHVSNWHMDLLPLCKGIGADLNLFLYGTVSRQDSQIRAGAVWVYMTRRPLSYLTTDNVMPIDWSQIKSFPPPTDEKGSLLPLLR